jgi:hypothetical protein
MPTRFGSTRWRISLAVFAQESEPLTERFSFDALVATLPALRWL